MNLIGGLTVIQTGHNQNCWSSLGLKSYSLSLKARMSLELTLISKKKNEKKKKIPIQTCLHVTFV